MTWEIKQILIDIATDAYGKTPDKFEIEIFAQERKTFHGQYNPNKKLIQIYNLSRPTEYVISTTIHELAHHIEFTTYGQTGHSKRFYRILKKLLETAVEKGYVKYNTIREKTDSVDLAQMEKYYGKIKATYDETKDKNKDYTMMKVKNSYEIKEELKARGFFYNKQERVWQKKILKTDYNAEKEKIEALGNVEIIRMDFDNIQIDACYFIIITGNTYDIKDKLKQNGFFWNGSSWVKKIQAKDMDKELHFIKKEKLNYKISEKNPCNKKHN